MISDKNQFLSIDSNNVNFHIDTTINEKRDIEGIILSNGIKVVLISDPELNDSSCCVGVGAGYLQDEFEGTAHFLEHLLFMGSEKYQKQNEYHAYVGTCGGTHNAFTADNMTCYYISLDSSFLTKGIDMLSWFFRAPILDPIHIKSEREIIDSEHNKNILSDVWIMDDMFKKFMHSKSKYAKFGTGNNESLKNIKKSDIKSFYDLHYTTDNLYVTIADSKSLEDIKKNYLHFFSDIETRKSIKNNNKKQKLKLISENLIVFKSTSEYNFLNIILIINCDEHLQTDFQLANLLAHILGTEYENSLYYYLKENNIIKSISSGIDYFYDNQATISIQFILTSNSIENLNLVSSCFNQYLNHLLKLDKHSFSQIYNNFKKIKLLRSLYKSNNNATDIATGSVENMIKGQLNYALLRNYIIPCYSDDIYNQFINIIDNIIIKITTNINVDNIDQNKWTKSKWYNSTYYITTINKIIKTNFDYSILNIIGIPDFNLEQISCPLNTYINKNELPHLIHTNSKTNSKIYLLETNKYQKPIFNISVIRTNINLLTLENKLIMNIYIALCFRILNYYLEIMNDYYMNFNISITDEYIIYNYSGLIYDDIIMKFIMHIVNLIDPNKILDINNIKYFNEIINDSKEHLKNLKYNSPFSLCSQYLNYIVDDSLMPDDKINYLNKITFEQMSNIVKNNCLKYTAETIIIIGIKQLNNNFNDDIFFSNLIKQISSPEQYQKNDDLDNRICKNDLNYTLSKNQISPNEINNCVIKGYLMDNIKFNVFNNKIDTDNLKQIIKSQLIISFIADILNEPLFDRIRTIDKLGYIVRTSYKTSSINNQFRIIIIYLIQSSYSVDRILESINNFNIFIMFDIKNNLDKYKEIFRMLKKSKLIELNKPHDNLNQEAWTYIDYIVCKYDCFDINKIICDICNNINFDDILKNINLMLTSADTFQVILDTNS